MCMCASMCLFMCAFLGMCMFLFACFTNYNLPIVCYQQYIKGSVYKYITSASAFFQTICDIMNVVNYNALVTIFFSFMQV